MKTVFVSDIKEGHQVQSSFQIARKELQSFKSKPGMYVSLVLRDCTGEIDARVWDDGENVFNRFQVGDVVVITGEAVSYKGQLQININTIVPEEGEILPEHYLPVTVEDRAQLLQEIHDAIDLITDPYLKELLQSFFSDAEFVAAFRAAPAAKQNHQAYLGGLLEHTVNVLRLARAVSSVYTILNSDLMIAGAILHDIGKIKEYQYDTLIDFTDEGRLLGHIILGVEMISRRMDQMASFPAELRLKLLHIVASHHGQYEWQSPKRPKVIEACALHYCDLLDSQMYQFTRAITSSENGATWSEWLRSLDRMVYLK
ncbi:MAG: HD domain-containing protein [Peptococcaceae bacterium]|nr:HD domain-containing protein [Peptococcaceae bacterium]